MSRQYQAYTGNYPTIPAQYPNRATRRAVKQGRMSRLTDVWRMFFPRFPAFLVAVKKA